MAEKKYGVVYTPDSLADFVAELLNKIIRQDRLIQVENILDPACGEGALLSAYKKKSSSKINYIGIDVDLEATENIPKDFKVYKSDTILPKTKRRPMNIGKINYLKYKQLSLIPRGVLKKYIHEMSSIRQDFL